LLEVIDEVTTASELIKVGKYWDDYRFFFFKQKTAYELHR